MSFNQSDLDRFLNENRINSIGRMCVILYVSNKLSGLSYPFSIKSILTEEGGQLKGLSGPNVINILSNHDVSVHIGLIGEAGRTNRGSVRVAEKFIEWVNGRYDRDGLDTGALRFIESSLVGKIVDLLDQRGDIIAALPTNKPNYIGPEFEIKNDKFVLKRGIEVAKAENLSNIVGLIRELRFIISDINDSFKNTHNSYHKLRALFGRYSNEISLDHSSIGVVSLYSIGLQIEAQVDAIGTAESEDPPFDGERGALVEAFRVMHGTLMASLSQARELISASAYYREASVDISKFRQVAAKVARAAKEVGIIEEKSADFIVGTAANVGQGKGSKRTSLLAIVTSRNYLSSMFSNVLSNVAANYITAGLSGLGGLVAVSYQFIMAYRSELKELGSLAGEFFNWLERALNWLL